MLAIQTSAGLPSAKLGNSAVYFFTDTTLHKALVQKKTSLLR